ncbi:MAG: transcriptional regulator [Methylobacter sp.]|jgi:hypothetical protein|uniref:transcriptional regulator n=1 Tax=Methylobacter sp. TaxID=2051955 RepID=UPI0025F437C9|nr:transcriptional regulator [Methylobacter sp.]MCK9621321.1 transcriptional regulator [Methylobacter sp.]
MFTVIETPIFQKYAADIWSDAEREAFINWLAINPEAGDVIPGTAGLRKVRWSRQGMGKRGGVRVIYFNRLEEGVIWLLIIYAKAKFDNLPVAVLNALKEEINNG